MSARRGLNIGIALGVVVSLLFGAAIIWASTFDNPQFAEPLIWGFAGSLAVTKVAIFHLRAAAPSNNRAGKAEDAAVIAGAAVAVLAAEGER